MSDLELFIHALGWSAVICYYLGLWGKHGFNR